MVLHVVDNTCISGVATQQIKVNHSDMQHITQVIIDCDVVTLGIAAQVLNEKYNEFLGTLEPAMAKKIHDTITEVLHEKY